MSVKSIQVDPKVVEAIHDVQLTDHGGRTGSRGELEPVAYGRSDLAECAAAYACGIARNRPFLDGNKRTAFVVMVLFLELNDLVFEANDAESVVVMLAVADGSLDKPALAAWIRKQVRS